jgi:nucleoside-diphosphate-sugar epimerase
MSPPPATPASSASTASLLGARALVTGASGFLGAHLCRRLRAEGAEVVAVSRSERPEASSGADDARRWLRSDLAVAEECERVVGEAAPDLVFHLASVVRGSRDRSWVRPTFEANLASAVFLLDAVAARGGVRFVQLGSLEEPASPEQAPCSPYAAAKSAASGYARMFAELYGVGAVVARVFMVYGPGPQDREKLVPYVIERLLAGEPLRLASGRRRVDWIFVEDVAEALARIGASADRLAGRTVDVGSGELVTTGEVVRRLHALLAPGVEPPFGSLPDRAGEIERAARAAETERVLGWRPRVGLDEGLARTVEWFRSQSSAQAR